MRYIVPGRVHRQRRIQQCLVREILHFTDRPPKPSGHEPVWPAHLEVVRPGFLGNISSENVGPRVTPDLAREHVIIGAQFFFNVSRQRRTEPAVTAVGQSVLMKILGELHLASFRLKPGHFLSDRPQDFARDTHCEWSDRFIASDAAISKL